MAGDPRDFELRRRALEHVRVLARRHNDIVPVAALREGFSTSRGRISFGSFYSGIYRPAQFDGPAALSLVTAPPKNHREAPYDDDFDAETGRFTYHYRRPQSDSPQVTDAGLLSDEPTRRYATREAQFRLHQHRFRANVLRAYRTRCAVCTLREAPLLQAAHIIEDRDEGGSAAVVNGIALCAIHHLAYDRNLMGIDPDGVVHIGTRLLEEIDGPMLRVGLQGFHGSPITQPRDHRDRPDRARLATRFERFAATA